MRPRRRLLVVGGSPTGLTDSAWGPFELQFSASLDDAAARLAEAGFDALLLFLPDAPDTHRLLDWAPLSSTAFDTAVLVVTDHPTPALANELLERGVQDLMSAASVASAPDALARAVHLAVGRKRLERGARKAYATDLATGLPNQAQLLEHMSHLLALREREPAPMALLVIRVEGLAAAEEALGEAAAAGALRRKLAVRLRASLRASDVVASLGTDAYAVLLAWIDAPSAAQRVAAKLARALGRPLRIATREHAVAVSVGVSHYPEQGKEAAALLRLAFAAATGAAPVGIDGQPQIVERGGTAAAAANDEA